MFIHLFAKHVAYLSQIINQKGYHNVEKGT